MNAIHMSSGIGSHICGGLSSLVQTKAPLELKNILGFFSTSSTKEQIDENTGVILSS